MTGKRGKTGAILSATQVARFCGVDLKTIHNWANKGRLPFSRTPGRHLRFRRIDIVDFMRQYGFALPDAIRRARPRVVVAGGGAEFLAAARRALSRRFDVVTFDLVVDALLALAAADPELLVLGEVALPGDPDPATVAARVRAFAPTRHVRVVVAGASHTELAALDPTKLREDLALIAGID
jgi:excisionase family DNA binding protein